MSAAGTLTPIYGLKAKREALPKAHRKIVKSCTEQFEEGLIDAIDEMISGISNESGRQASYTSTVKLVKRKGQNIAGSVQPRVRAPRENYEFEVHPTDDRQLEMGWVDTDDDDDGYDDPPTGDQPDDIERD